MCQAKILTPVASAFEVEVDVHDAALEGALEAALVRILPLFRHNPAHIQIPDSVCTGYNLSPCVHRNVIALYIVYSSAQAVCVQIARPT